MVSDYYRGMQISNTTDGKKIFASARDVGNLAAGFVAAVNGVIWPLSRTCFDGLESIQKNRNVSEGIKALNLRKHWAIQLEFMFTLKKEYLYQDWGLIVA